MFCGKYQCYPGHTTTTEITVIHLHDYDVTSSKISLNRPDFPFKEKGYPDYPQSYICSCAFQSFTVNTKYCEVIMSYCELLLEVLENFLLLSIAAGCQLFLFNKTLPNILPSLNYFCTHHAA